MSPAELTRPAYPSEWTIADVLSHLGSGAVITCRPLDDTLAGRDTLHDFAPRRGGVRAHLAIKERALARTTPPNTTPGKFRPGDRLLTFLESL